MNFSRKSLTLFLAEEAYEVLRLASISFPEGKPLLAEVAESDDLGLWLRIDRDGEPHDFLLRWEYILGIDKHAEAPTMGGLRSRKGLG